MCSRNSKKKRKTIMIIFRKTNKLKMERNNFKQSKCKKIAVLGLYFFQLTLFQGGMSIFSLLGEFDKQKHHVFQSSSRGSKTVQFHPQFLKLP